MKVVITKKYGGHSKPLRPKKEKKENNSKNYLEPSERLKKSLQPKTSVQSETLRKRVLSTNYLEPCERLRKRV